MSTDFYKNISPEALEEYAMSAGIGSQNPLDLEMFEKFLKEGSRILEVGCGTGRLGKVLIKDYDYVGIDSHQPYLDYFIDRLEELGIDSSNHVFKKGFFEFEGSEFDAILFPWTVIGDFGSNEQTRALKKAYEMLQKGGVVILDNPAKGVVYNTATGYTPTKFYFEDWKNRFASLGFSKWEKHEYDTPTGRKREITVLYK